MGNIRRKSANCSHHHSSAIADKKITFTWWNFTSAGLSHRAGDFNKEISGKTKVRRYERGEKRSVNDLPRLYNREFTAYRRHRCRRETRRKEKKRRERERKRPTRHAPDFSSFTRLISWRWYVRALLSWAPNAPYDDDEERFREPFFPLFVPWNVLTLKRGSRSAHDISAGDLTSGLLEESFRSNENMKRSSDSANFTFRRLLLPLTIIIISTITHL